MVKWSPSPPQIIQARLATWLPGWLVRPAVYAGIGAGAGMAGIGAGIRPCVHASAGIRLRWHSVPPRRFNSRARAVYLAL